MVRTGHIDVKQEAYEMSVIVMSDTVVNPWAVMISCVKVSNTATEKKAVKSYPFEGCSLVEGESQ